jgi:hypothetical protein
MSDESAGLDGGSETPVGLFRPYILEKKNIVDSCKTLMLTRGDFLERRRAALRGRRTG